MEIYEKISNACGGFLRRMCVVRRRGVPPCSEYVGFVFGTGYAVCGIRPKRGSRNDGVMFYQFFLEQKIYFGGDWANFKIGRISMGGQFNTIPVFGALTSGAFDSNPAAVFSNSPFTSSPIATWGALGSYNTADNLSF